MREKPRSFFKRAALCLALPVLAIMAAILVNNRTFLPLTLQSLEPTTPYPIEGPRPASMTSVDMRGGFNMEYAFNLYTVFSFREGYIPFWNPYQGFGQPFHANYLSGVFSPFNLIRLATPHDYWDLILFLPWLLAGLFSALYFRALGLSRSQALVGGLGVLSCGFFQNNIHVRSVMDTVCFFPLALYGVERALKPRGDTTGPLVLAGGVFGLAAGGQPEAAVIAVLLLALYLAIRVWRSPDRRRAFWAVAPGVLCGGLIAAPIWVPFLDYLFRGSGVSLHPDHLGVRGLDWRAAPSWFMPHSLGMAGWNDYKLSLGGMAYLGWFPPPLVFLGLCGIGALVQRRTVPHLALAGLGALAFAKILGAPGVNAIGWIPYLDQIWFARFTGFAAAIALAFCAALGVRYWARASRKSLAWIAAIWAAFLIANLGMLAWLIGDKASPSQPGIAWIAAAAALFWGVAPPALALRRRELRTIDQHAFFWGLTLTAFLVSFQPMGFSNQGFAIAAVVFAVVFLAAAWRPFPREPRQVRAFALKYAAVLAAVLAVLLWRFDRGLPLRADPIALTPTAETLKSQSNHYRVYGLENMLYPNFAAPIGLSSINNLEVLLPEWISHFSRERLDGAAPAYFFSGAEHPRSRDGSTPLTAFHANRRFFELAGVRWLVTRYEGPNMGRVAYDTQLEAKTPPRPLRLSRGVEGVAELVCPVDTLASLEVFLSGHVSLGPGCLRLRIHEDDGPPLRELCAPFPVQVGTDFFPVDFEPIENARGRKLRFVISYEPEARDVGVAAWIYPEKPGLGFRCRITEASDNAPLAKIFGDARVQVRLWENEQALPRVFLATEAIVEPDWRKAIDRLAEVEDLRATVTVDRDPRLPAIKTHQNGRLKSFELEPNRVHAVYEAPAAGVLTFTDTYAPGWRAEVNGEPAEILRVDGVFRGVALREPGTYRVTMTYRPPSWNFSLALALLGAGGMGLLLAPFSRALRVRDPAAFESWQWDQEEVLASVKGHLDSLSATLKWALLLAIVFWWAGVQQEPAIQALGLKIPRAMALSTAVVFYLVVNVLIWDKFYRLGDLLQHTEEGRLRQTLTRLAMHPWFANPFAYFADGEASRANSAKGFGCLVLAWWLCNASLYSLADRAFDPVGLVFQGLFLLIGLATMRAVHRVHLIALQRSTDAAPGFRQRWQASMRPRAWFVIAGVFLGALLALLTQLSGAL